jgi:hypothetical protein
MKHVTPIVLAASLSLTSFSTDNFDENARPAEVTARGLITALRQSSEERFVFMFPKLSDFHAMMDRNAKFYGLNVEAAKEDFTKTYNEELMPAVRRAYVNLLTESESRGIDWSEVIVESVNIPEEATGFSSIAITFSQGDKKFSLLIERSLMIGGKWKVSQYVKFR